VTAATSKPTESHQHAIICSAGFHCGLKFNHSLPNSLTIALVSAGLLLLLIALMEQSKREREREREKKKVIRKKTEKSFGLIIPLSDGTIQFCTRKSFLFSHFDEKKRSTEHTHTHDDDVVGFNKH